MGSNAQPITATTRICAVYGHPVKHSASPAMHNAAMHALGLDWRYTAFDVHPENLRDAIHGAAAMKFVGLNLTVPHKLLAMDIVTELDDSARTWGAVNTILFEGLSSSGDWKPMRHCNPEQITAVRPRGFNTDADAITRSLKEDLGVSVAGKSALLLGAGGAGRTAALKLASDGIKHLYLVNRTTSKAEAVANEIQQRFPNVIATLGYPAHNIDLVMNATSAGLRPEDPLPFDSTRFSLKNAAAAYDMIYRPVQTKFLDQAARCGCKIANGLGMLLYQGAKAFEIWSGLNAPIEIMRAALQQQVYGKS
jgi:shikimate dehydrogenase